MRRAVFFMSVASAGSTPHASGAALIEIQRFSRSRACSRDADRHRQNMDRNSLCSGASTLRVFGYSLYVYAYSEHAYAYSQDAYTYSEHAYAHGHHAAVSALDATLCCACNGSDSLHTAGRTKIPGSLGRARWRRDCTSLSA
jgi:hypothetical protein